MVVDRVTLVACEIVEELLDIGIEAKLPRLVAGDETVDLHVAVGSDEKIPGVAGDGDGGDFATDGPYASDLCKPADC